MQKDSERFTKEKMFTYNHYKKIGFALAVYGAVLLCVVFMLYYFLSLKNADNFLVNAINTVYAHVISNLRSLSIAGALYASFFGGLFFTPFPTEIVYLSFLRAGRNVVGITLVFLAGIVMSYWANYQIGFWLRGLSKRIIGAKNFYKTKNVFNKYGPWAIFLFNAGPLPSQPLCTVLGVFNYNRKKFWFYTLLGEIVKFTAMAIGYFYII